MDNEKKNQMIERITAEIKKIDDKSFTFFFYVIDTKGNPSGSLGYIYDIAYGLHTMGYNVMMLHSEEEFVGVGEWMGEKYAELPHSNIEKNNIQVSPADILFIPELFSNVMTATKNLPCLRVAILQSFDKLCEIIPFGASWSDLGIHKAITTTDLNVQRVKNYFPNLDVNIVKPAISNVFTNDESEEKKLIVNIVTRDPSDVNRIVKPFFWQYPMYRWVAFRDLRGQSREDFANALSEAAITVWVDDPTDFGFTPLEAMKSGSIVVGKVPAVAPSWMIVEKNNLTNAGLWVDNLASLPSVIASVVRTWTLDMIPEEIYNDAKELTGRYTQGQQLKDINDVIVNKLVAERRNDFVVAVEGLNKEENNE